MKNANSRFIRVLAVALVVLMVLPAALVGCGSDNANDAAISEALAAAQAAKDAAEKAQQKAEAAQKELDEANKKAEQLEKELEALKTTKAPEETTAPVSVDKQQVLAYAQEALAEVGANFAAYAAEAEIDLKDYVEADKLAMEVFHAMTVNAIYKAATIDDIVEAVEGFKAYVEAMPTYADRVYEAYKAIDFASDVDVVDVVYAYAVLTGALVDNEDAVAAYGEDELDLAKLITEEYARYTGADGLALPEGVDEALYEEIYDAAQGIFEEVDKLLNNDKKLDVATLKYADDVKDKVEEVKALFEEWFEDYFKGEEIEANYEAFRQAFIGEDVIADLNKTEDAVWAAVLAMEERAAALEAALVAYEDGFQEDLEEIAGLDAFDINLENGNMNNHADLLAAVKAELAAWIAENDLADEEGKPGEVVVSIIGEQMFKDYNKNALVIEYFSALCATMANVDAAGILAAYDQYDSKDLAGRFDFAKYGAAVKSFFDWTETFNAIDPATSKGYEAFAALGAEYKVATLLADDTNYPDFFEDMIENYFDLDIEELEDVLNAVAPVYLKLADAKAEADKINKTIAKLLKAGITKENGPEFIGIAGNKISAYFDQANKDKNAALVEGLIKKNFFDGTYIQHLDVNYNAMINWADLEALWDSFDAMKADVEGAAVEIMNTYFAANADENLKFVFDGDDYYLAKGTERIVLDAYAYELIKKIDADGRNIDVTADVLQIDNDLTFNYKAYDANGKAVIIPIDYATAYAYAKNMVASFHVIMADIENALVADNQAWKGTALDGKTEAEILANEIASKGILKVLPLGTAAMSVAFGGYQKNVVTVDDRVNAIFANTNHKLAGAQIGTSNAANDALKAEVLAFFNDNGESGINTWGMYQQSSLASFENNGNFTGYADSVVAVNPAAYFTFTYKVVDGVEDKTVIATKSFDKLAYKAALDKSLADGFKKFKGQFVNMADANGYKAADTFIQGIIERVVNLAFAYDLWDLAGAFDAYTYTIDVNAADLADVTFVLLNAKKKAVTAVKVGKFVDTDVYAKFDAVKADNGVYALTYELCDKEGNALANETEVKAEILTKYEDLDECLADRIGFVAEDHVFDVRNAAEEIGANFAKFNAVNKINSSNTYRVATAAEIQAIFDAEKTADFNNAAAALRAIIVKPNGGYGSYIPKYGKYYSNKVTETEEKRANYNAMIALLGEYTDKIDAAVTLEDKQAVVDAFIAEVDAYFVGKGYPKAN